VEAVQAAGLVDVVAGADKVITVFAPTDEAFGAALTSLETTKEDLFANTDLLKQILTLHVVPGVAAKSTDLSNDQSIATANEGQSLTINLVPEIEEITVTSPGGTVARVQLKDVMACKAVVHVIDKVLIPKLASGNAEDSASDRSAPPSETETCKTPLATILEDPDLSTLASLAESTGVAGTLDSSDLVATIFAPINSAFDALVDEVGISPDVLTSGEANDVEHISLACREHWGSWHP